MKSSDDYLTDIIPRRIIFSPTDEYFGAHGWMDTDFAMLMFFLNTNFSLRLADHQRSSSCCAGWDRKQRHTYNLVSGEEMTHRFHNLAQI